MSTPVVLIVALEAELPADRLEDRCPIVYSGVGKVHAAIATMRAIATYQPALIVNFGTAGRIDPSLAGLVHIGKVVQRDMCAEPLAPRGTVPFSTTPDTFASGLPGVTCGTGDSFVTQADPWLAAQGIGVVDMELFAIAAVAHAHGVPWQAYKYLSDDANGDAGRDWAAHVRRGAACFLAQLPIIAPAR